MMDSSPLSSSDDDDELYIAATHVVSDIANSACHRGSVEGHHVLNCDRQSGTSYCMEIISQIILRMGRAILSAGYFSHTLFFSACIQLWLILYRVP